MAVTATNPERPTRESGRTMKAIVHERYGLDALELREVDRPVLEDDQVLIRVRAASATRSSGTA